MSFFLQKINQPFLKNFFMVTDHHYINKINKERLYCRPGFLPGNLGVLFVGNGIPTYNLFYC